MASHDNVQSRGQGKWQQKGTPPFLPSQEKTSPQQTFHHISLARTGPGPSCRPVIDKRERGVITSLNQFWFITWIWARWCPNQLRVLLASEEKGKKIAVGSESGGSAQRVTSVNVPELCWKRAQLTEAADVPLPSCNPYGWGSFSPAPGIKPLSCPLALLATCS